MTDNEIIKALECCSDGSGTGLIQATLDLINRQKAEIERLKAPKFIIEQKPLPEKEMREALKYASCGVIIDGETTIKRIDEEGIKAEAVKEFAEIIVADYPEMEYYLDNLVKEFTEGEKK
jgi:hypothetical protein